MSHYVNFRFGHSHLRHKREQVLCRHSVWKWPVLLFALTVWEDDIMTAWGKKRSEDLTCLMVCQSQPSGKGATRKDRWLDELSAQSLFVKFVKWICRITVVKTPLNNHHCCRISIWHSFGTNARRRDEVWSRTVLACLDTLPSCRHIWLISRWGTWQQFKHSSHLKLNVLSHLLCTAITRLQTLPLNAFVCISFF